MKIVTDILRDAKGLAEKSKTWADLSNSLFDPIDGLVIKYFPDVSARREFRKSDAYNKLHELVEEKMKETQVVDGAQPKKSGKFVVRLPRSLHRALDNEAKNEGTSLNQLVLTKLAVQLNSVFPDKIASILRAFGEVRQGYSSERVVADPKLNRVFVNRCRELGVAGTDYEINWELFNARKSGKMSLLPKTKKYTIKNKDEFEYAPELAVCHLQRSMNVSLDQIICDPDLAKKFDEYAMRLAPGYTPLEYRWVALGLRKAGRRNSNVIKMPDLQLVGSISRLKINKIPENSGLYLFSCKNKPVFLSHTDNLKHRLERHMENSNSKGLPKWLWDEDALKLSLAEMPGWTRAIRQNAELLLIDQLSPVLNISHKVA